MEVLIMSNREIDRLRVVRRVLEREYSWQEAGKQLGLCIRQIGYICARVRREGNKGVIHRLRGRPSNRKLSEVLREKVLKIVRGRYWDFGPTFANEKLLERHRIEISTETLRSWMVADGIWEKKRQRVRHRAWRERRSCVGELVQVDGSLHKWFEERGGWCVLIAYIDDATSQVMHAEFAESEDTLTLMRTSRKYVEKYGRPVAFYVDKDSIFKTNREPNIEEQLKDERPSTQFTRAVGELGIGVICADSPQAKGRIERLFKTFQDRLIKEMRLRGISTIEDANRFLHEEYLKIHNERFAKEPANHADAHRPLLATHKLDEVFSIRTGRTLLNDYTIRLKRQFYQLLEKQQVILRPKAKIVAEERLDGSIHLRFKDKYLDYKLIPKNTEAKPKNRPFPLGGRNLSQEKETYAISI